MSDESTLRERFIATNERLESVQKCIHELKHRTTNAPMEAQLVEVERLIEAATADAHVEELSSLLPRREALRLICESAKGRATAQIEAERSALERELRLAENARAVVFDEIGVIQAKLPPLVARIERLKKEGDDYMPMHVNQRNLAPVEAELARLKALLATLDDCPSTYFD
jgi:chromosome segregation ATPase